MNPKITPISRDPVEREAAKRRLAGDPLGALEVKAESLLRQLRLLDAYLSAPPCRAFRDVVDRQRAAQEETQQRKATLSLIHAVDVEGNS